MDDLDVIELYYELDIENSLDEATKEKNMAILKKALQKAYDAGRDENLLSAE